MRVCLQVEALEKSLSAENNAKKIDDMETELEIAGSEVRRLQKALEDMEEWKEKLVKESNLSTHSRIERTGLGPHSLLFIGFCLFCLIVL